jgi:hypothetical protein
MLTKGGEESGNVHIHVIIKMTVPSAHILKAIELNCNCLETSALALPNSPIFVIPGTLFHVVVLELKATLTAKLLPSMPSGTICMNQTDPCMVMMKCGVGVRALQYS